ncbi:MAG TPA: hypothetical protein VJM82_00165, partial [Nitrospiraceae bacterium]|nr:hypothetical protein [Nitrospiraceae bacterium]
ESQSPVRHLCFSSNGRYIAIGLGAHGRPGGFSLWDSVARKYAHIHSGSTVNNIAFNDDGSQLATASGKEVSIFTFADLVEQQSDH